MGVISAKKGALTTGSVQAEVRNIEIEYSQESAVYGSSATDGSKGREKGNSDWKATFQIYGYVGNVVPGTAFTLTAYTGTNGGSHSGDAIVDEMTVEADIKGGGLVTATIQCSSNGLLTRGTTTVTDAAVPAPKSVKGLKVNYDGSDRTDATGWSLTLRCATQPYHSAATYDSGSDTNYTKRLAGPVDASGSWTELQGLPASLPAEGENSKILKLYVTSSLFFEIKWVAIESVAQPVPIEEGGLVESTINWGFNGFSGGVKGFMKKPDTTAFWP